MNALTAFLQATLLRADWAERVGWTLLHSFLFFHPGMWWVSNQVRKERENCCDDIAVALSGNRTKYVRALTRLEEQRRTTSVAALAATGGLLLARVRRLLGQPTAEFGYRNATTWLSGLVTIGFVAAALATGDAPQENLGVLNDAPVSPAENSREFRYVAQPERPVAHHYRRIAAGLPGGLTRKQLLADVDPPSDGPQQETMWQWGWFTYGQDNSRSVAVALRKGPQPQLWIDLNRDKRFAREERIQLDPADRHRWRVVIGAEFLTEGDQYEHCQRSILVRQSSQPGYFEIATEGIMQGSVLVDGKWLRAVRIDRNSNGRWFDASDRILLDINRDGGLDPIGERIACDSVCRLDGKRFVLQSDMQGHRLELAEFAGQGSLVAQLKLPSDTARIDTISGTLASRDGIRVTIRALDQPSECPVGDYLIESVTLEVSAGQRHYWFSFRSDDSARPVIAVKAGQAVTVDLLGQLTLTGTRFIVSKRDHVELRFTPRLTTSTGLYLTGSKVGRGRPTAENRLLAESLLDNQVMDISSTGFS